MERNDKFLVALSIVMILQVVGMILAPLIAISVTTSVIAATAVHIISKL